MSCRPFAGLLLSLLLLLASASPITPSHRIVDGWETSVKYSEQCVRMVKNFEGFRATAYRDPVGVLTIGYGTTFGVKPGQTITEPQATERLCDELEHFARGVTQVVKVPLTQNQFDALVSFSYNVGLTAFKKSTLLRLLNQKKYTEAAAEFPKWRIAGGKILPGLVKRRAKERALFEEN